MQQLKRFPPSRMLGALCCALVLGVGAVAAAPAAARVEPTGYFLEVSKGSTTSSEYPATYTSGFSTDFEGQVVIRITRGGETVAEASAGEGYVNMPQVPQIGDLVTLESPSGTNIGSATYDGLPSMDSTVCAGSTNFSGRHTPNTTVQGVYFTIGSSSYTEGYGTAHIESESGSQFAGSFPTALTTAETVYARQAVTTPLPEESSFSYFSRSIRPVGSCSGGPGTGSTTTFAPSTVSKGGSSGVLGSVASTLSAPLLAHTANIALVSGSVTIRLPGTNTFVALSTVQQIPFGSTIDATNGTVTVTVAARHGGTQTAQFSGGRFILTQGANGLVVATLTGGDFSVCRSKGKAGSIAAVHAPKKRASASHVVRKLWADAKGNFRTMGRYSSATVRGTKWLTEDTCAATLVRVARGVVSVFDIPHHRTRLVKAPHSLLSHPGRGG